MARSLTNLESLRIDWPDLFPSLLFENRLERKAHIVAQSHFPHSCSPLPPHSDRPILTLSSTQRPHSHNLPGPTSWTKSPMPLWSFPAIKSNTKALQKLPFSRNVRVFQFPGTYFLWGHFSNWIFAEGRPTRSPWLQGRSKSQFGGIMSWSYLPIYNQFLKSGLSDAM